MKAVKKPIPTQVNFADSDGSVDTLEGTVAFWAGDAIVTGVTGERWPISRSIFEQTYEAVSPGLAGKDGPYLKKLLVVDARKVHFEERVTLSGGAGILRARPGDWLLTAPDGSRWVVAGDVFAKTYELLDEQA